MARRIQNRPISLTLAHSINATTIDSSPFNQSGVFLHALVTLPALDNAATATLNIKDASGNVLYTKASIAGNATTDCIPASTVYLAGNITYEIVTSASQTSDKAITITPYIDSYI